MSEQDADRIRRAVAHHQLMAWRRRDHRVYQAWGRYLGSLLFG